RVRIALALKDVPYTQISQADIGWPAYEALYPSRLLPTLVVDGVAVGQSGAILDFVEETWPEPALLPKDRIDRARVRAFGLLIASDMHPLDTRRVRKFMAAELGLGEEPIQRWQAHWAEQGFRSLEEILLRRSEATPFAFGETPGWADLHLVPHMRKYVTRFGFDFGPFPTIMGVYDRCNQHPAFRAAAPKA
ncbi:MAG: glutathione S-transferase N-terminal domain-containing protein, partial [Pseudomonadota bacterium]